MEENKTVEKIEQGKKLKNSVKQNKKKIESHSIEQIYMINVTMQIFFLLSLHGIALQNKNCNPT